MKNRYTKRRELQRLLQKKTKCAIQYTGWPCNTCFFAMDLGIDPDRLSKLWLATLKIRGDYPDIGMDDATLTKNVDELIGLLRK